MSLYRKYRPQKFEDLIGQDHVAKTLKNAIKLGKISHSYLFAGPRGTGKTTVARILAKATNCTAKSGQPCGKCLSCQTIGKGQSVDILEIDAASNRGIDEIRELRDKVRFTPSHGKYKVYIIDEVHMLTKEAFNALLKTLEEPPAHAIFILATTEAHKVPATIVSRCQRFDFHRASLKSVLQLLEKVAKAEGIKIEVEALALLARAADGAYRDGLTLLEQMSEGDIKITAEVVRGKLGLISEPLQWQLIHQTISGDKESALKTFNKLTEVSIDWKFLTTGLLQKLRQLLFYKIAPSTIKNDLTDEEVRQLQKLSTMSEEADVVGFINLFLRAEAELRFTSVPEIPLGAAIVEYLDKTHNSKLMTHSEKSNIPPAAMQQLRAEKSQVKTETHKSLVTNHLVPVPQDQWLEIVSIVKKTNSTLAGLLKQSHPYLDHQKLIIEVPYPFWEERINSKKNAQAICAAACEVLQQEVECAIPRSNGELKKLHQKADEKENQKLKSDVEEVFGK